MLDRRRLAPGALALLALPALAGTPARAQDAWSLLEETRGALAAAGPLEADFTQSYVPAGFTTGERERGRLALALPDCLRWDYAEPYPKVFLLCEGQVRAWSPGERSGRVYALDREDEPGLDLLLLGVDRLRARYRARREPAEGGRVRVTLEPVASRTEAGSGLRDAALLVDPAARRVVEVSYHDDEGNFTRFEIERYRPLRAADAFTPPAGLAWEE